MKRLIRWCLIRIIARHLHRRVKVCKYDKHEIYLLTDRGYRITIITFDELQDDNESQLSDIVAWDGMARFFTDVINDAIRYKRPFYA